MSYLVGNHTLHIGKIFSYHIVHFSELEQILCLRHHLYFSAKNIYVSNISWDHFGTTLAVLSEMLSSNMRMHRFRFIPRIFKFSSGHLLSIDTFVSNESDCGQWRPRSDCADAQADLGIRCPHMLRHVRVAQPIYRLCIRDYLISAILMINTTCFHGEINRIFTWTPFT